MHKSRRGAVAALSLLLVTVGAPVASQASEVANPIVRGPVSGGIHGWPQFASLYDIPGNGYIEEEFFISGEATDITDGGARPYTTRIVVRRPGDAARFNGTAVVEWVNVTGAADLETMWPSTGEYAMREGYAWVSVSAQLVGTCCGPHSLKGWDPVRYATILHPGDDYSFDIFSQAIAAVRYPERNRTSLDTPQRVDPMGGLRIEHVIAHGASQSAGRLTSYLTRGDHARARLADAFSITRGGGNADVARIAEETETLVVQVNEESIGNRPADTAWYVVYEEPGVAHAPLNWYQYVWRAQARDLAPAGPLPDAAGAGCSMNRGTSQYTHRMSLAVTQEWLADGIEPPHAPRIIRDGDGAIIRDEHGLATGGIRYPFVEVPIAYNAATGCPLFGQYIPWSQEKILSLYPSKAEYVALVDAVSDALVAQRLMLPGDAAEAKAEARALEVWSEGTCFDTQHPATSESGPVSSVVHEQTDERTTLGVPNAMHEASCSIAHAGL